ncbi:16982_t:CDS:2 [Entrophospora sp. SA101]|nr:16982_t:CDS:2 [Entrophospora sp. SA101]CAJ0829112.1 7941_t:CDS:2 [Entrophospora sp. SA101]CAJ0919094.1 481_t:CDS:2 [Entrophospora sp. SA101]
MAQMWCISCQTYREHAYTYCGGACNNNCYNRCSVCGRETLVNTQLTSTSVVSTDDMIGMAQRSGFKGEVSVKVETGNVRTDHMPSARELRGEVRDMLNQANQLPDRGLLEQRNYDTGNSSALVHSQQNVAWDNAVNSFRDIRVPLYDSQGRQIIGQENIKREVARREAE